MSKLFPQTCPLMSNVFACSNRSQCFEPCGDLGRDLAHAKRVSKEVEDALDGLQLGAVLNDLLHLLQFFPNVAKADEELIIKRMATIKRLLAKRDAA